MGNDSPSSPEQDSSPHNTEQKGFGHFWAELRRRKVVRVAITYAIVAWLIIQIASTTFEGFGIPIWAFRFVMLCVILGYPLALILTWAFELTPDGIKTTRSARQEQGDQAISVTQQRKRNWYSVTFAAAIPTLIFGSLALVFYIQRNPDASHELDKSIAVLPFTNMSPDAENAYFADGIHETILTNLANLGDLRVISRTSVMPYRDSAKPIPSIGEELNAAYILEGSVQKIGNTFRLTTQLIHAHDDNHLWARNYDGEFKDVFAVQSQLAREISQSLKAVISPEEQARLDRKPTENLEAYELYLKAVSLGERNAEKALLLEQVIALDPGFASAWANLSRSYIIRFSLSDDRTEATFNRAKDAILTALRLDPDDPEVLFSTGFYFQRTLQYSLANYFYRTVLEQVPNDAYKLRVLGTSSIDQGEWKKGMQYVEAAYRLEPGRVNFFFVLYYSHLHDWRKVIHYFLESEDPKSDDYITGELLGKLLIDGNIAEDYELEALPKLLITKLAWCFGDAAKVLSHFSGEDQNDIDIGASSWSLFLLQRSPAWLYAIANLVNGNSGEAERVLVAVRDRLLDKYSNAFEDYVTLQQLGLVYALLGEENASLESFEKAFAYRNQEEKAVAEIWLFVDRAIALAWLGRTDEAVDELARLIKVPSNLNPHMMRHCLDFWPLRDHPGFQAIINDPANLQPLDMDKL